MSTLVEALVDRLGPHKLQAYMTLAGLESGSSSTASSLYRRIMAAAHRHGGGGEQLAMAMVGKLPEVVELVQKVLDLHSDPESMKVGGPTTDRRAGTDWAGLAAAHGCGQTDGLTNGLAGVGCGGWALLLGVVVLSVCTAC